MGSTSISKEVASRILIIWTDVPKELPGIVLVACDSDIITETCSGKQERKEEYGNAEARRKETRQSTTGGLR